MSMQKEKTGYPSKDRNHEDFYDPEVLSHELPDMTLYDFLHYQNKGRLHLPAINYFDNRISYQKFLDKSTQVALALDQYGVKEGDYVTVVAPTLPEAFYILVGASRIGAVASLVDPRYGEKAIEHKINKAASELVIGFDGVVKTYNRRTKQYRRQHVLDKIGNILENTPAKTVVGLPASNSISLNSILKNDTIRAAMFDRQKSDFQDYYSWKNFIKDGSHSRGLVFPDYTSDMPVATVSTGGSTTGLPKNVVLSSRNIITAVTQCILTGIFPEEARWYDIMPISIAYGMADGSMLPFALGNEVRLNPDPTAMSLKKPYQLQMVEDLVRFDPHTLACAPNHVFALLNSKEWKENPHSMINFIVGGDSLNKTQLARANEQLKELKRPKDFDKDRFYGDQEDKLVINLGYGESEGTGANSVAPGNHRVKVGSVGQILPLENMAVFKQNEETGEYEELKYVQNDQVDNVNEDQIGELCIQGDNVMIGYQNDEEATNIAKRTHSDGTEWLHTGDLGYIDEDGYVYFVDREKYVSVGHDGFKITPLEIEDVILKDGRIDACKAIVYDDPDEDRGTVIKVYYTLLDKDHPQDINDIEDTANLMCERELADYKCPLDYECLPTLPLTNSGKIDVLALREDAEAKSKAEKEGNHVYRRGALINNQ